MASVHVDPGKVHEFKDARAFQQWLGANHERESEVWIKLHKVGSGLPSITPREAIDVVLCWGWIDAVRKSFDDKSYLQRYTPRGPRSIWSQVNVANVARLIAPQPEDRGRTKAEDRGFRPDAQARRDNPPANAMNATLTRLQSTNARP